MFLPGKLRNGDGLGVFLYSGSQGPNGWYRYQGEHSTLRGVKLTSPHSARLRRFVGDSDVLVSALAGKIMLQSDLI